MTRRKFLIAAPLIIPVTLRAAENVKTFNAVARANIKSLNGVALANIKSINGVDNTSGGGACTTEQITNGGGFDNTLDFAFYTYQAFAFLTVGAFTACAIDMFAIKIGTPNAETITASIWTNSGTNPGALVGSASTPVSKGAFSGSAAYQNFTGLSASLSAATVYQVVFQASAVDTNGGNCIQWISDASSGIIQAKGSTDGSSWDSVGTLPRGFKIFSA